MANTPIVVHDVNKFPVVVKVIAAKGVKGDKGDKGDTGPQGATGPQGPQGIQGVSITTTEYVKTEGLVVTYRIKKSDGTVAGEFTVTNGQDGEITGDVIASPYDNTKAYKIGNLLSYEGKQYYCIADAPAGTLPTNTTYFEEKSVADIIEMIKQGAIVTGHSAAADNLTPYSEDSGTTQENPFISQGTGTDNNSVIVTTGNIAKQLEKQGNTVGKNQLSQDYWTGVSNGITVTKSGDKAVLNGTPLEGSAYIKVADPSIPTISGHKYLLLYIPSVSLVLYDDNEVRQFSNLTTSSIFTSSGMAITPKVRVDNGTTLTNATVYFKNVDLTQWFNGNDNIPADLLANPSHFSWYYNGSLAYDAGEIKHGDGVKLVCTRGRNLWDEQWVEQSGGIKAVNQFNVVPNSKLYIYCGSNGYGNVYFYDQNKNYIGINEYFANGRIINVPSNAWYAWFSLSAAYGVTYKKDITITPYYTEQQGGEGYDQHYDYEEPDVIDTGSEILRQAGTVRDVKLHSGEITRNVTVDIDLSTFTFQYDSTYKMFYTDKPAGVKPIASNTSKANITCSKYLATSLNNARYDIGNIDKSICLGYLTSASQLCIRDDSLNGDVTAITGTATFELEIPTTEQGTSFRQYAGINDYGIMYWLNANDELVSIPQGCKIQYPVNYKGFIDDAYMYTNGDATALAKNEDITDSALNARGYYKMQVLSSEITDVAGLTYSLKKAYKCGNVVTITVQAFNGTGSSISAGSTLFTVGTAKPSQTMAFPCCKYYNSLSATIVDVNKNTGECHTGEELGAGNYIYINITYAVA